MRIQRIWLAILAVICLSASLTAQDAGTPLDNGLITGTVTDTNGDTLAGATVALQGADHKEIRTMQSEDNGSFQFRQLPAGNYSVVITAQGFASWNSTDFSLNPGQYFILTGSQLRIATATTSVNVSDSSVEVATEQVQVEETQRAFGILPNFYVVYEPSPAPLTTKLKFHLAMKTSSDAVTILGVAALAGMNQAGDTPDYSQGWKGYGQRVGAVAANGLSDIMIGGAILPSLLHQDPRYYYQGTGTTKPARSTRSPVHLSVGETTASFSQTIPAWGAIWAPLRSPTSTIPRRTAVPDWCSQISYSLRASAC